MLNMITQVLDMAINHYNDVIMSAMASQITSITIVYSTAYSGAENINTETVTRKMLPFDDVIMYGCNTHSLIMMALIFIEAPRFSSPSKHFTLSS